MKVTAGWNPYSGRQEVVVSTLPVWKVRTRVLSLPSSIPGTQLALLWARQHAQLQATTKHPPTSDLPSAAVSDRCPALYCRW